MIPTSQTRIQRMIAELWRARYRYYGVISIALLLPILSASSITTPPSIDAIDFISLSPDKSSFVGTIQSFIYQDVVRIKPDAASISSAPIPDISFVNSIQRTIGAQPAQITISREEALKTLPLDQILERPVSPVRTNFLTYSKYNINVPVIYSQMSDIFETDRSGNLIVDANGSYVERKEDVNRNGPEAHPIQRLLKDGIVHIAFTANPGEIGNSYIVGHSSNFSSVRSSYNTIFKPIERVSKVGETFTIWDQYGRELTFKVFEVKEILEREVNVAYYGSDNGEDIYTRDGRRVVTLQTSILEFVRGQGLQPTKRWLTRGELVIQ